uniref:HECT-type E3 ubiquitin transferase n=1 Tax=Globisporangium ultimum (strain ATCC 200006 / CBS 805.95 / DAOM BR144) TaxID=431595 RepID=K3XBD9_GLOUD
MWRPHLFLALLTAAAWLTGEADAAGDSAGTLPPWLAYVTGGLLVVIIVYYCCRRARFDENLQQPLLGGQYTEDGQPMTRQDVQDTTDELNNQWKCEVCDFHNKDSSKACVLCGTERGFSLGLNSPSRSMSVGTDVARERSFNRTRSFAIRRLNMLNARQRGARNRQDWVRKVGIDGKRYWAKKESPFTASSAAATTTATGVDGAAIVAIPGTLPPATDKNGLARSVTTDATSLSSANSTPEDASASVRIDIPSSDAEMLMSPPPSIGVHTSTSSPPVNGNDKELVTQPSLAFVSQLAQTPRHPEGRMTFKEYREVDARVASRGYEISEQDLEILEQVAALPFKDKYAWFLEQTSALIKPWEDGHLKMRVHRENILVESMEQLLGVQMEHIHMPLRIEFIGEVAIDAGGLEREWFALVTERLFDETIGLFMCAHVDSLAYVINPNSVEASADHLLYFRGAGRLLGRALLEGQLMKAHLALPVLKHLLGVPISFSDLEFYDQEVYKSLKWMKENDGVDALCLDFSVTNRKLNGEVEVIDLKEDGRNIEVTDENKHEYIYLRLRHIMLDSFAEQLQHLMAGVFEVIPQELILVFDYQELELVLCGVPSIDVDDWKAHTQVSDELPEEVLGWFWEIVEAFSDEERARLLQFTTGSSRVPVQGFKALTSYDGRICHFTLKAVPFPENAYPRAHTCFNRIDLPVYKTKKEMEEVLSLVINMEVTGFTDE